MEKANDQASTLRQLIKNRPRMRSVATKPLRVISVTSGKGGVGKTNVVANLSIALQKMGHRVLILDGDFGLSNLNIVMGLEAQHTISDVLSGSKTMKEIIIRGPHGVHLIPASSGVLKMTELTHSERNMMMEYLESIPMTFDILLIDTGAGIHSDVAYLNAAANEVIVVVTPEPTSIADAYALMKIMSQNYGVKRFKLLANRILSEKEAFSVYQNLLTVSDRFLNIRIEYLGYVLEDEKLAQSVRMRKVLIEAWPSAPASICFENLSKSLMANALEPTLTGNVQFFWKTLLSEAHI